MSTHLDRISRHRIAIVSGLALSYLFLQLVSLSFAADWTGLDKSLLMTLENIGMVVFLVLVLSLGWLANHIRSIGEAAHAALYDELVKDNLRRAMQFGYKALFLVAVILFGLTQDFSKGWIPFTAEDIARICVTAALVIPYLRFAYLESRNA